MYITLLRIIGNVNFHVRYKRYPNLLASCLFYDVIIIYWNNKKLLTRLAFVHILKYYTNYRAPIPWAMSHDYVPIYTSSDCLPGVL